MVYSNNIYINDIYRKDNNPVRQVLSVTSSVLFNMRIHAA